MDGATIGLMVGGIGAAVVLLLFAMSRKPMKCPACGREQPVQRTPASMEQAMWGGSTCAGCGADLDSRGRLKPKK
jgi:transposase-like protein